MYIFSRGNLALFHFFALWVYNHAHKWHHQKWNNGLAILLGLCPSDLDARLKSWKRVYLPLPARPRLLLTIDRPCFCKELTYEFSLNNICLTIRVQFNRVCLFLFCRKGKRFQLVLDAECCLDRLYGGFTSDWVCGGQWNRMFKFLRWVTNPNPGLDWAVCIAWARLL